MKEQDEERLDHQGFVFCHFERAGQFVVVVHRGRFFDDYIVVMILVLHLVGAIAERRLNAVLADVACRQRGRTDPDNGDNDQRDEPEPLVDHRAKPVTGGRAEVHARDEQSKERSFDVSRARFGGEMQQREIGDLRAEAGEDGHADRRSLVDDEQVRGDGEHAHDDGDA